MEILHVIPKVVAHPEWSCPQIENPSVLDRAMRASGEALQKAGSSGNRAEERHACPSRGGNSAHNRISIIVMSLMLPESCTMLGWASVHFSSVFYSESRLERAWYLLYSWSFGSGCPDVR
jgi:hypothetical protein